MAIRKGEKLLVTCAGSPVAWLDPATGAVLTASPNVGVANLQLAYDKWRNGWEDLAENDPGEQAQIQADAAWAQMGRFRRVASIAVDAKTEERAWRVGAKGERVVGGRLEKLRRRGFELLHSVPIGNRGSDIDHLLIGPPGVFSINTKNHPRASIWVHPTPSKSMAAPTRMCAIRATRPVASSAYSPTDSAGPRQ